MTFGLFGKINVKRFITKSGLIGDISVKWFITKSGLTGDISVQGFIMTSGLIGKWFCYCIDQEIRIFRRKFIRLLLQFVHIHTRTQQQKQRQRKLNGFIFLFQSVGTQKLLRHCGKSTEGSSGTSLSLMLRRTVSRPVCLGIKHPSGVYDPIFITVRQLRVCWCGALSLTRGGVCRLQLLLALASSVSLGFESCWTLNSIIRDFPFRRLLRLAGLLWKYSTPPPHGTVRRRKWMHTYIVM
jgi:hypothetical protein